MTNCEYEVERDCHVGKAGLPAVPSALQAPAVAIRTGFGRQTPQQHMLTVLYHSHTAWRRRVGGWCRMVRDDAVNCCLSFDLTSAESRGGPRERQRQSLWIAWTRLPPCGTAPHPGALTHDRAWMQTPCRRPAWLSVPTGRVGHCQVERGPKHRDCLAVRSGSWSVRGGRDQCVPPPDRGQWRRAGRWPLLDWGGSC